MRKKQGERTCPGCGVTYQPRRKGSAYCSHECYAEHRRGKHGPGNFTKGAEPVNKAEIGTVRIRRRVKSDGTRRAFVKVAEPNVWRFRAHVVWELANGRTVEKGMYVHHVNGDKLDDRPENLLLIEPSAHLAGHVKDTHNDAQRTGLVAAWARRRETRTCVKCGSAFSGVIGKAQDTCKKCRHKVASEKYKAKMRVE